MPAAEAGQDEHAGRAADQTAYVAADRDAGQYEAQGEVDHDQPHRAAAEHVGTLALENESGTKNPEDRAGGANGDRVGRKNECTRRTGEARDEIDEQEPRAAEVLLDRRADPVEEEHVEAEVDGTVVQERGRDQPPPVAVCNQRAEQRSLLEDLAADPVDVSSRCELEQEDPDVDPNQRPCHEPNAAGAREPANSARHPRDTLRLPRVLGAALADRRRRHALGADRSATFGARDVRLSVGVPVAPHRSGHVSLA